MASGRARPGCRDSCRAGTSVSKLFALLNCRGGIRCQRGRESRPERCRGCNQTAKIVRRCHQRLEGAITRRLAIASRKCSPPVTLSRKEPDSLGTGSTACERLDAEEASCGSWRSPEGDVSLAAPARGLMAIGIFLTPARALQRRKPLTESFFSNFFSYCKIYVMFVSALPDRAPISRTLGRDEAGENAVAPFETQCDMGKDFFI